MSTKNGFTLLEVLLAIFLLVSSFVALVGAISIGLFTGSENENELISIALTQEKTEQLRLKSFDNIVNESMAVVPGFSAFQRGVTITLPRAGLKQAVVNVTWTTKSDQRTTSLATYISDI